MNKIKEILKNFQILGDFKSARLFGNGHINDTYLIKYRQAGQNIGYILRMINSQVFENPEQIIENTVNITNHIRNKLIVQNEQNISGKVLSLVPNNSGNYFYLDTDKNYWCVVLYFKNGYTIDSVQTEKQAFQAAKAFGSFQLHLSDFDITKCHTTIKDFHNLSKRISTFHESIEKDLFKRVAQIRNEIEKIESYSYLNNKFSEIQKMDIPLRITHNDTKIDNVMLSKKTNESMSVIDLDTVMPGSILNDFGDMVRSFTSSTLEDEKDFSKVQLRLNIFEALAMGFLNEVKNVITNDEKQNLVSGAMIIVYEQAIRFLTDYIDGDHYYKVDYEQHNLDRTRNQIALLESIKIQSEEMEEIVKRYS